MHYSYRYDPFFIFNLTNQLHLTNQSKSITFLFICRAWSVRLSSASVVSGVAGLLVHNCGAVAVGASS